MHQHADKAAFAVLATVAAVVVAGCGGSATERVSLPPVNASPAEVVRTYVAALNGHAEQTVDTLTV